MRHARHARRTRNQVRDLVLAVAALSLLAMPVTYTGGAEVPHPHIFFQVWLDVAHGSFDHHDHQPEMASRRLGDGPATPTISRRADPHAPTLDGVTAPDTRELALVALTWVALVVIARQRCCRPHDDGGSRDLRPTPESPPPRGGVPRGRGAAAA